jgi:hypothetical protein
VGEVAARHAVDISVTEVQVAYYMSDGSTARAQYPSTNTDPTAAVEALLKEKKQSGAALAVDSLDSDQRQDAERFISPDHVVAWTVR